MSWQTPGSEFTSKWQNGIRIRTCQRMLSPQQCGLVHTCLRYAIKEIFIPKLSLKKFFNETLDSSNKNNSTFEELEFGVLPYAILFLFSYLNSTGALNNSFYLQLPFFVHYHHLYGWEEKYELRYVWEEKLNSIKRTKANSNSPLLLLNLTVTSCCWSGSDLPFWCGSGSASISNEGSDPSHLSLNYLCSWSQRFPWRTIFLWLDLFPYVYYLWKRTVALSYITLSQTLPAIIAGTFSLGIVDSRCCGYF